jgi:hypothetical protein
MVHQESFPGCSAPGLCLDVLERKANMSEIYTPSNDPAQILLRNSSVEVKVSKSCRLAALVSCLEYGLVWLIGRGVWRFSTRRQLPSQGDVSVTMEALVEPAARAMAGCGDLAEVIPALIPPDQAWSDADVRTSETIIQCSISKSALTIAQYAFAISEAMMALFLNGCTQIKCQVDGHKNQLLSDLAVPDTQSFKQSVSGLLAPYDPSAFVGDAFKASFQRKVIRDGQHRVYPQGPRKP